MKTSYYPFLIFVTFFFKSYLFNYHSLAKRRSKVIIISSYLSIFWLGENYRLIRIRNSYDVFNYLSVTKSI